MGVQIRIKCHCLQALSLLRTAALNRVNYNTTVTIPCAKGSRWNWQSFRGSLRICAQLCLPFLQDIRRVEYLVFLFQATTRTPVYFFPQKIAAILKIFYSCKLPSICPLYLFVNFELQMQGVEFIMPVRSLVIEQSLSSQLAPCEVWPYRLAGTRSTRTWEE